MHRFYSNIITVDANHVTRMKRSASRLSKRKKEGKRKVSKMETANDADAGAGQEDV